jgi:hypothetical protein
LADINLTHAEADALIEMEKCSADEKVYLFPRPGERISIPLTSPDKRESFMLDVTRAQIKLTKATYQDRARQAIILMRLDLDGPVHRNPDGKEILCPHLHVYREGYGDKWAVPAPTDTRIPLIFLQHSRRSCCTATSRIRRGLKRGCSHDNGE